MASVVRMAAVIIFFKAENGPAEQRRNGGRVELEAVS